MQIHLRRARPENAPAVAALFQTRYRDGLHPFHTEAGQAVTHPEYRRHGLAVLLIQQVVDWVSESALGEVIFSLAMTITLTWAAEPALIRSGASDEPRPTITLRVVNEGANLIVPRSGTFVAFQKGFKELSSVFDRLYSHGKLSEGLRFCDVLRASCSTTGLRAEIARRSGIGETGRHFSVGLWREDRLSAQANATEFSRPCMSRPPGVRRCLVGQMSLEERL
jgi:hypothetical protein